MRKKKSRQVVFVCAAVNSIGELAVKMISAGSPAEASSIFTNECLIAPKEILGPFYKKRAQVLETVRVLKFSNQNKKAIYNDWFVQAHLLKEPENQAYLVFIKRVDDKKITPPKGTVVVPISELRFCDV